MVEQIFEITNEQSAFVLWRKITIGCNTRMKYHCEKDDRGLCAGITAVWLKKSLASKGRGIKTAVELGSKHLMAIVHGVFARTPPPEGFGLDSVDSIPPLLTSQSLIGWEALRGKTYLNPQGIAIWASLRPCHCLLAFENRTSEFGHIIGMRCESNTLEMFDPCQGLFQYSDMDSFVKHLQLVISKRYPDCLGGNWGIFRVKSALD
ncbi:hypothetical protein NX722_25085 [Endozoicomonas gorgoniicola]|uniref:Peptidase C58 YopT-type domain-containing protein n=1 Tax=Endozoicomonas gorgoniicola TaxID=1234144 RepID=A0ABT3N2I1_9GAMM|nr:hypothetical protein [Endozoicomonas gorgoniicola]MCW7555842.1 hypothetical protein [Endozoicomonas gorgoniicola]